MTPIDPTNTAPAARTTPDVLALVDLDTLTWNAPATDTPEFATLVQHLAEQCAPQPFAIAAIYESDHDAEIIAWGTEFPDVTQLFRPDGEPFARCQSADSALRLLEVAATVPLRLLKLGDPSTP